MSERERFEAWAKSRGNQMQMIEGEYACPITSDQWEAWQAACPEGWKCVPAEPTLGMLNEGHRKMFGHEAGPTSEVWDAMLSAAPTPGDV